MVRLWGVLFGIAIAIVAGLMIQATFAKATEKFSGDAAVASPSDFERLHSTLITGTGEQDHE